MDNLTKLRELTAQITSWQPKSNHEGYSSVEVQDGISKVYKLMYEPKIAVAKAYFSKGCKYQLHKHGQKEFVIVYDGAIEIQTMHTRKILEPGDCFYLNIDEPHQAEALEETWAIVITVPASEVFPQ